MIIGSPIVNNKEHRHHHHHTQRLPKRIEHPNTTATRTHPSKLSDRSSLVASVCPFHSRVNRISPHRNTSHNIRKWLPCMSNTRASSFAQSETTETIPTIINSRTTTRRTHSSLFPCKSNTAVRTNASCRRPTIRTRTTRILTHETICIIIFTTAVSLTNTLS